MKRALISPRHAAGMEQQARQCPRHPAIKRKQSFNGFPEQRPERLAQALVSLSAMMAEIARERCAAIAAYGVARAGARASNARRRIGAGMLERRIGRAAQFLTHALLCLVSGTLSACSP